MCGVAPALSPKLINAELCTDILTCLRHSRVLIRFLNQAPGSPHANMSTIARLCEAQSSLPSLRDYVQHIISSAGDNARNQTSFRDPLRLVLYSADWLPGCVTERRMRTHVRAAEADRPSRVADCTKMVASWAEVSVWKQVFASFDSSTALECNRCMYLMGSEETFGKVQALSSKLIPCTVTSSTH